MATGRLVPIRGPLAALALAALVAACSEAATDDPPAEFIAVKRAWLPGERTALINRIVTNHEYVFPYVGDISPMAPQLFADSDSVTVLVPNPDFQSSVVDPVPFGAQLSMFNAAWNFVAVKVTSVVANQTPPDTLFWHIAIWSDPADPGNHGQAIAFSRNATFNISPIKTTNFDAAGGKAGAGAGEYHKATNTYWEDDGGGGRFQVTAESFSGAYSTITSGPYLGGLTRTGTQNGRVSNSSFVRISGAETPANFTVSFDYRVTPLVATEIICVFPSPCTTNIPVIAGVRGNGWR